jgi:glycosyltransferase involved in cell wall biosynthesis
MVTASVYERDNRVLRYAQTLADRGDSVEILALAHDGKAPRREQICGVDVARFGVKTSVRGILPQIWGSTSFLLRTSVHLTRRHLLHSYDLVHVHNMPDFLVFAAWLPRWTGAAIILDVHDIFPEFYATRFGSSENSLLPRILKWIERRCARFASHVIVSNHIWRDTFVSRSVSADRCSVFINSVDTVLFAPVKRTRIDRRRVIIYPGSFNRHQGLDLAVAALARVRQRVPEAELHLYGMGPAKDELVRLCFELGLNDGVYFHPPVPLNEMPSIMANADVGVVPKRASDFFGNQAFSTKIMEFMSQGLPVVVSRTLVDTHYYNDDEVRFFDSEDVSKLAAAILDLLTDEELRNRYADKGREFVARNCWATRRKEYLDLVDSLAQ